MIVDIENALSEYKGKCENSECGEEFNPQEPIYFESEHWLCGDCKGSNRVFCNFSLIEIIEKEEVKDLKKEELCKLDENCCGYTQPYETGVVAKLRLNHCSAETIPIKIYGCNDQLGRFGKKQLGYQRCNDD